ncbi:hypothetical protein [Methylorubrum sp. SB2]|uniref:hypothetical protein n=1 Tax=Methylorubrum subtropicum TaxID=3138812 RepID=UPI00313DF25F
MTQDFLANILSRALNAKDGHALLRPLALISSDLSVLETFLTVSCNQGQFEDASLTLQRLKKITNLSYIDAEKTVKIGRKVLKLLQLDPNKLSLQSVDLYERGVWHHSVVTQAVIGAAEHCGRLDSSFAKPLADALEADGFYLDAAVLGALRHLLVLGRDACAIAFLDLTVERLSITSKAAILDYAIASAVHRDAMEAALHYARRFEQVTACTTAGFRRITSHVGIRARNRPGWAESLRALRPEQAVTDSVVAPSVRPFPSEEPVYRSDGRIDVFLKCVKRPFDIHPFVSFWMECFNDPDRYRIVVLDDTGLNLKDHYSQYSPSASHSIRDGFNEAHTLFLQSRRPLNLLGWESIANLTPFAQTKSRWFWNIDADDIRPLLSENVNMGHIRSKLQDIENFAEDSGLMAISYDLWASVHYLFDHGYHWTFGICLCRSEPYLLGRMFAAMAGCDIPSFRINLDHLLSRLSDGRLGDHEFSRYFASFIFDRVMVLQKDPQGNEIYHMHQSMKKRIGYDPDMRRYVQDRLHPKTVVI